MPREGGLDEERNFFLATTALLTMLILIPMALAQEETTLPSSPFPSTFITGVAAGGGDNMGTTMVNGSPSPPLTPLEDTGGHWRS
jgi:hypothetical protein